MRPILLVAVLTSQLSATVWAQSQTAHDMSRMDPVALAAHCVQMKKDMAHGSHATTPEMHKMMAQCDELDRNAAVASRRR